MNLLQTFEPFILAVHFMVSLFLIVSILLQAGKGADMGAAFGAGSSQTLFGARGAATFLSKLTTVIAVIFLTTSISLAAIHKNKGSALNSAVPAPAATQDSPDKPLTETVPPEETKTSDTPKPVEEKK